MSDKFQNKYRIPSSRLKSWDYSKNGIYFVTICIRGMNHYFGEVEDGVMQWSEIGEEADRCWKEIPKHFSFVELDEYVVMPNHVHGIIVINKTININNTVETQNFASPNIIPSVNKFGPQSQNLASIVRGFKIGVTKYARQVRADFEWQERYYDEILGDMNALENVRRYIRNNPEKWGKDKVNS